MTTAALTSSTQLQPMASAIRLLTVDMVGAANSGHPGMPMGMADVATVLFSRHLKFDAANADWPDRDRFVLSAGHGSPLMYSLLYLSGYPDITLDDIKAFRTFGAKTAGHPEWEQLKGVEVTTGPLGQGIANAVGLALAERMLSAEYGDKLVDHHTYVMAGDGCLMEGIAQEAITFAAHNQLGKLILLFDDNAITIDGATDHATSEDQVARFSAAGWHTQAIDGHDFEAIDKAIAAAKTDLRPSMIACKTIIGKGSKEKQGTSAAHHGAFSEDDRANMQKVFDWPYAPFEIPQEVLAHWRLAGARGAEERAAWLDRLEASAPAMRDGFNARIDGQLPETIGQTLKDLRQGLIGSKPVATRAATLKVLDALFDDMPAIVSGSADLAGSTQTRPTKANTVCKDDYSGRYIAYGVREHAMGAIMNGIALHGGFVPFGGTFLCFLDYARHAIRLAAMMHQQVIFVGTHDSITVGEDGPTHQPIEHLAGLRAVPNLNVFRPADAIEAIECYELALQDRTRPSVMILSRANLPVVRSEADDNLSRTGAYVLQEASAKRQVTLIATGSEVSLALDVREELEAQGIPSAVVSLPNWRLFDAQSTDLQATVLGDEDHLRVSIEAQSPMGWERYVGRNGLIFGVDSFGISGAAPDVYKHFGFSKENIISKILKKLSK